MRCHERQRICTLRAFPPLQGCGLPRAGPAMERQGRARTGRRTVALSRKSLLGCRQAGKATGFGPVIRGFESFRPSQFFPVFSQSSPACVTALWRYAGFVRLQCCRAVWPQTPSCGAKTTFLFFCRLRLKRSQCCSPYGRMCCTAALRRREKHTFCAVRGR